MSSGVDIRDYRPGTDEEPLRQMVNEIFGLSRDAAYWRWKYHDNPAGQAMISLAEMRGRPVSMACALPIGMMVREMPTIGSISVEAAARSEIRGTGIYTKVAKHLYQRMAEKGINLTYGFANRYSNKVTLEVLGRHEIRPFPLRLRPLRPGHFVLTRIGFRRESQDPGPTEVEPGSGLQRITRFDESWDRLWQSVRSRVDIGTIRDMKYLNWRYADHPDRPYEILAAKTEERATGYLVWRILDRFGTRCAFVADFGEDPQHPGTAERLLRAAANRARCRGASILSVLSWPGGPFHEISRRFCFLTIARALFPQPITFSVISHDEGIPSASLAQPGRWWIAWGDSDVV